MSDAEKSGDASALGAGFERMWRRAWSYINDPNTPAERSARHLPLADPADVIFLAITGMKKAEFEKKHPTTTMAGALEYSQEVEAFEHLPRPLRASRLVKALLTLYPELKITSTDTTPSKLTTGEMEKVKTTAKAADNIFATIASGSENESLQQVFGAKYVATAKKKYAAAKKVMDKLVKSGDIVTDRSGYRAEEGESGSTAFGGPITLTSSTIDDAGSVNAVSTLIHESLHAANADVGDKGYIESPGFTSDLESIKLTNAAHFEVVPRRVMAKEQGVAVAWSFPGQTFTPSAPGTGHTPGATGSDAEKQATDMLDMAWNVASMLHTAVYIPIYQNPGDWDLKVHGASYSYRDYVPYWSKVEKLTIHERLAHITSTAPAGWHKATAPVTEIDLALSEDLVRDLAEASSLVPDDDAGLRKAITAAKLPDAAVQDRMSTVEKRRDLIIELVCGIGMGGITGSGARDLRMVHALAEPGRNWSKIEKKRSPSDFPD